MAFLILLLGGFLRTLFEFCVIYLLSSSERCAGSIDISAEVDAFASSIQWVRSLRNACANEILFVRALTLTQHGNGCFRSTRTPPPTTTNNNQLWVACLVHVHVHVHMCIAYCLHLDGLQIHVILNSIRNTIVRLIATFRYTWFSVL